MSELGASSQQQRGAATSRVDLALGRWRAELLDLSRRNRLLYLRPGRGVLRIVQPAPDVLFDGLENQERAYTFYRPDEEATADEQLSLLLGDGGTAPAAASAVTVKGVQRPGGTPAGPVTVKPVTSAPRPRPARPDEIVIDSEPRQVEAVLYRLRLRARSALLEQGINVLFVTFGTLEWTEADTAQTRVRSPLLLAPVALERATALAPYRLVPLDDALILNPALARKLAVDFNLTLDLPDDAEGDLSLPAVLDHIRRAVAGRPAWQVHADVHLGLFSFAKYAMYADLEANQARFSAHPLIRAIAGEADRLPEPAGDLPTAEQLDERVRPAEVFQVLDADASQLEAIAAVKAGVSLIIQGPPGTGKSQTIVNIIAETLAQGKTVLFVSEKMAALRVVAKRLAEAGLREFCLEVHSQEANKAAVVRELKATLDAGRAVRADDSALDLERLATLRHRLNAYVRALHDAGNPLGRSAFAIHGEIARRQDAPVVQFDLPDAGALTAGRLAELLDAVRELVRVGDVLQRGQEHPWHGCLVRTFTPQLQAELDGRLRHLAAATDDLAAAQASLRATWGLPPEASLRAAEWLRDLLAILDARVDVPPHWLQMPDLAPLMTTAGAYHQQMEKYRRRRAALLERYAEGVFGLDLAPIQRALEAGGAPAAGRLRGDGAPADRAIARRREVQAAVERAVAALDAVRQEGAGVAGQLGLPPPLTLAQARHLQPIARLVAADPRPQRDWFAPGRLAALEDLVAQAGQQHATASTGQAELQARFDDEFFDVATAELVTRFETDYASWLRLFRPSYHRDLGRLRRLLKEPGRLGYDDALAALKGARRVAAARAWLDERRAELAAGLGYHYAGARTDWAAAAGAVATVRELVTRLGGREPPAPLLALLIDGPAGLKPAALALDAALARADEALAVLTGLASLEDLPFGGLPAADVPLDELAGWLRGWRAALEPLWAAVDAVAAHRHAGPAPVAELAAEAREARALRKTERALDAAAASLRADFGHLFTGLDTRWEHVLAALGWAGRLLLHCGGALPATFVAALAAGPATVTPERERLISGIELVARQLAELEPCFTATAFRAGALPMPEAALPDVSAWARAKQAALAQLEEWIDLSHVLVKVEQLGLAAFVDGLRRDRPPRERWPDAFLRQVYTLWLTWRYDQTPALARFRGRQHEEIIAEFRQLDRWQWQAAARRIAQRLVQKRPLVTLNLPPRSEPAILIREASKKRRFRPLRKLFADLPHLLPALKPCLLMSPLSVAQFLGESAITFDVVIFDEASQILPADAIGAIGRGRQLVVVGDQQQLPPTRFFTVDLQPREESDEDEEVPESILDACEAAGLPSKSLLWHYRSRHEHLIAFSNRWFYDGRLITFPSPDDHERAVRFIHVAEGVYDRAGTRTNRTEARRVADLVVEHVERHPDQSLGVITFSEPQMMAILAELEARKRKRPELEALLNEEGLEGFFVKNLENVQGDERDVIFFSVGYGPDQAGHMTMTFGPLNQQGGERRLNVAITRARQRITILASFLPHAIDLSRTQAKGVHLLRRYLEFAERGPVALLGEVTAEGGAPESPFEQAVAGALTARGLRVVPQVGVGAFRIDLGIKDEASDRYLLGIECDGATYHSSRTARDRDRLRQQVLEQLGWRIHRIWSTDWLKDPAREVERVLAALAEARTNQPPATAAPARTVASQPVPGAPGVTPAVATVTPAGEALSDHAAPSAIPSAPAAIARPYVAAVLPPAGGLADFRQLPIASLAWLVEQVVAVEGPVHQDRVMRAVAASFAIARVGSQVRHRLLAAIQRAARAHRLVRRGEFLWPPALDTPAVRTVDGAGVNRSIQEVAPEEIAAGVTAYLAGAFSIGRDDLVSGLARALGYDRAGAQVAAAIGAVIDQMIASGRLIEAGGQVRLPG
jgi:very-short-patch-repair endonuclease